MDTALDRKRALRDAERTGKLNGREQIAYPGGAGADSADIPTSGTPTTIVQKEGDGAAGSAATWMPSDALLELQLRVGAGPGAAGANESGLEQANEEDKLGVVWESDSGYIASIVASGSENVGDRGTVARGNHAHALLLAAGGQLEFSGGELQLKAGTNGDILYYNSGWQNLAIGANGKVLKVTTGLPSWETEAGGPSPYTSTPEFIGDQNDGSAGSSANYSRGDHIHPSTITGETSWQTNGHANEAKIYAVWK
jgi:hypothetical protein